MIFFSSSLRVHTFFENITITSSREVSKAHMNAVTVTTKKPSNCFDLRNSPARAFRQETQLSRKIPRFVHALIAWGRGACVG